jgi:hypothetical protein
VIDRDKEPIMLDPSAEVRHQLAVDRTASLRRSAEPVPAGPLRRSVGSALVRARPRLGYAAVVAVLLAAVLTIAGRAAAAGAVAPEVEPFGLTFVGGHGPAAVSDLGWRYEGTFTASAPFCAAGSAADVLHEYPFPIVALRSLECSDGSGTVTVQVSPFTAEEALGGSGTWTIVDGTGRFATLRGRGTWGTVEVGDYHESSGRTFRTALSGVAAFDVVAPAIVVRRSTVTRNSGARLLELAFSAPDDHEANVVSYRVTTHAGRHVLAESEGTTAGRVITLTQRIHPANGTRRLTVVITATDAVGNLRRLARAVRLTPTS